MPGEACPEALGNRVDPIWIAPPYPVLHLLKLVCLKLMRISFAPAGRLAKIAPPIFEFPEAGDQSFLELQFSKLLSVMVNCIPFVRFAKTAPPPTSAFPLRMINWSAKRHLVMNSEQPAPA
jgi:hypothetical protein